MTELIDDPDWDWIPVTDGSVVEVGDTILFGFSGQWDIASIDTVPNGAGGTTYTFSDGVTPVMVDWPPLTTPPLYTRSQYVVTDHPPVGTEITLSDGSLWVFAASKTYRCIVGGSTYPAGTVLTRALMVP